MEMKTPLHTHQCHSTHRPGPLAYLPINTHPTPNIAHLIVLDHLRETRISLTDPPVELWNSHGKHWPEHYLGGKVFVKHKNQKK